MKKWLLITTIILTGCASAPPLSKEALQVREITKTASTQCEFLKIVQYVDTLFGVGKSPAIVRTAGENGLRNSVAQIGGNAYVLLQDNADWFLGNVAFTGEAYKCLK